MLKITFLAGIVLASGLFYYAVYMCRNFGRERKCSAVLYLPCHCQRKTQLYISWKKVWLALWYECHSCVLILQPSALRSARTEEPVHLQIPAVVLMAGLGAPAVKVCRIHALVQDLSLYCSECSECYAS